MEEKLLELLNEISYYLKFKTNKTSGQNRILSLLKREGEMNQRDLTSQLGIQSGSVSEILEKMETKGLIFRRRSTRDGRTFDIFLTERGLSQANEADQEHLYTQKFLFAGFTDTEKDVLGQLLSRLLSNLQDFYAENYSEPERPVRHRGHRGFHKHRHKHGRHPKHRKH